MRELWGNVQRRVENLSDCQIYSFGIVLISAIILLGNQSWVPGFFHDGYLYAALGKNTFSGYWWMPRQNDYYNPVFNHHPPLAFILEGLFFHLVGANWVSARFFGIIFAIGVVSLLYFFIHKHKANHQLKAWAFLSSGLLVIMQPFFKKSRYPNTDFPLMFFILLGLYFYFESLQGTPQTGRWKRLWGGCGICFGLALLTKGPFAFSLPLTILFHLLLMKQFKVLKNWVPWFSFLLGIGIFCLWPLILYKAGMFAYFQSYLNSQVFNTAYHARGEKSFSIFAYFTYLNITIGPLIYLAIWGMTKTAKKWSAGNKNSLELLFLALFLAVFAPLSIFKWKLSHYLMPAFPAIAACAALPLSNFSRKFHQWYFYVYRLLVLLVGLVLLVFPLTTKIRRDVEIFKIIDVVRLLPNQPQQWYLVENSYPFYNVLNLMSWIDFGEVSWISKDDMRLKLESTKIQKKQGMIVLVARSEFEKDILLAKTLKEKMFYFYLFPSKDLAVFISDDFFPNLRHARQEMPLLNEK